MGNISLKTIIGSLSQGGSDSGGGDYDENSYVIDVQINDTSYPIYIADWGSNYGLCPTIDWGDGIITENDWSTSFNHYYNETGNYRIIWKNGYQDDINSFMCDNENKITNVEHLSYNRNNWNNLFEGSHFVDDVTINMGTPPDYLTSADNCFKSTKFCKTIRIKINSCPNLVSFTSFFAESEIWNFYADQELFGNKDYNFINLNSAFKDCGNLQGFYDINGTLGGFLHFSGNFNYMFQNCYTLFLDGDWNNIPWIYNWTQPYYVNFGATRYVNRMFDQCYNLYGIVEPTAFWNHPEVDQIYIEHGNTFSSTNNLTKPDMPDGW